MICQSGAHLLQIINDILEIAKGRGNRLTLAEDEVNIPDVVALSTRIIEEMARKAQVEFSTAIADGLADALCRYRQAAPDPDQSHVERGQVHAVGRRVTLRVVRDPDGVVFHIEDTGIGIAPDKIPIALAPFGQVDSGLAREIDASGWASADQASHRAAWRHDGDRERPGKGTVVSARFPPAGSSATHWCRRSSVPAMSGRARRYVLNPSAPDR